MHMDSLDRLLERFIAHISVERGLADRTVQAYRADLNRYFEWLRGRGVSRLEQVSRRMVEDYVACLDAEGLNARSKKQHLAAIHMLHRFAVSDGDIPADETADVKAPRQARDLPDVLTVDEVAKLLDTARMGESDDPTVLRNSALLEFMYASGARVSEAINLDLEDLDLNTRMVRLWGKGMKQRLVPLGSVACDALRRYLDVARPKLSQHNRMTPERRAVFLGARGRRIVRQTVWRIISETGRLAGIGRPLHPHTLRHSFATHLLQGGANIRMVQTLLGHESVDTTQIYAHVAPTQLMETYATSHPRARFKNG